jgi:branched-chain amino acid transport system permease protein
VQLFNELFFELLNGVVWGLILAMIALGLCLIYGLMGVINIAHGSFYMVGAVFGVYLVNHFGVSFWVALIAVPLLLCVLGLVLNTLVFERVVRRDPTIGILATAGLLLIIDNSVLAIFGGTPESIAPPVLGGVSIFGVFYPAYRLVAAGIAIFVLVLTWLFLRFTVYGLWMRATPQKRDLASAIGIPIGRVNQLTVMLGALTAGLAGVLVAPISAAYFQMGLTILAASFMVVVIGGLGNLPGVIGISLLFGVVRGMLCVFMPPTWAEVAVLLVLLPIMYFKPNGIFEGWK